MEVITTPKKNLVLDATTLSSLMSCARFHDIRFNHRLVSTRGKSNSLEVGSLIHKVLEVFYKHQIDGFPRNTCVGNSLIAGQLYIQSCQHCANAMEYEKDADGRNIPLVCGHEPQEYPGLTNTPEQSEGYVTGWRFAMDTCQQYFDFYKNDSFIPLAAEVVKGDILYEDDEIRIGWKAKFDLIEDTNQIGIVSMDHKTFKQRRDKSTLSNQFIGQCLLLKSRNMIVNKIGLQKTLKIDERLTREIVSISADRLLEWQSEILPYYAYKYIQFSESGYWPPDYTHCETMYGPCPYKCVCEADRGMREEVLRNEFQKAPVWDPRNKEEE